MGGRVWWAEAKLLHCVTGGGRGAVAHAHAGSRRMMVRRKG